MEFGKHLEKGLWGIADKALPAVYGINYVALIIRTLPAEEFGNFVLIQEAFLIVSGLIMALALIPLLKFTSEEGADRRTLLGTSIHLHLLCLFVSSIAIIAARHPLASLLNSPRLADLLPLVPVLLAASFFRSTSLILLQARFRMREIFWVDATHFLGSPLLTLVAIAAGRFHSALDLILITIASLSASSVAGVLMTRAELRPALRPDVPALGMFWKYGRYAFGGQVSYLFTTRADSFVLSAFAGPLQVATYNAAKVFIRVFDMAGQVIQTFLVPAVSKLDSRGDHDQVRITTEKALTFGTVAMIPFLLVFLFFAPALVGISGDKYADAVPLLRIMSFVALVVTLIHVASSVLMGLGHSAAVFLIYLRTLACALGAYFLLIPWLGSFGAAIGYTATSFLFAWFSARTLKRHVPLTLRSAMLRTRDIVRFLKLRAKSFRSGRPSQ